MRSARSRSETRMCSRLDFYHCPIPITGREECYFQKALHRLRPCDARTDSTSFFYYIMSWATAHGVFAAGGNESTIEHLPAEKFRKYRFAFPPISEQLAIVDFLNKELDSFDTLTAEAERGIQKTGGRCGRPCRCRWPPPAHSRRSLCK